MSASTESTNTNTANITDTTTTTSKKNHIQDDGDEEGAADGTHGSSTTMTTSNLFGSFISKLFDQIHTCIEPILRQGIATLPLLSSSSGSSSSSSSRNTTVSSSSSMMSPYAEDSSSSSPSSFSFLLHQLYTSYTENMDLVEQYVVRNIFTIQSPVATFILANGTKKYKYTKRQEMELIQRFMNKIHNHPKDDENDDDEKKKIHKTTTDSHPTLLLPLPYSSSVTSKLDGTNSSSISSSSNIQIPTPSEIDTLENNVYITRYKLRKALLQRNNLQQQIISLQEYMKDTLPSIETLFTPKLDDYKNETVEEDNLQKQQQYLVLLEEKKKLQSFIVRGKEQLQHLHQIRIQRGDTVVHHQQQHQDVWIRGEETIEFGKEMKQAAIEAYQKQQQDGGGMDDNDTNNKDPRGLSFMMDTYKKKRIIEWNVEEEYYKRRHGHEEDEEEEENRM